MPSPAPISVFVLRLPAAWAPARALPPAWLARDDAARYRSMPSARRRAEFAAARLLLRHALADFAPALRWRLAAAEGEAPRIVPRGRRAAAPSVSLAHSAGYVACAVSGPRRLGVDIERHGARRRSVDALAPAVLHPRERAALARLPARARLDRFLRCWTLKEALAKALGKGLALPFREFAFDGDRLAASPARWAGARARWSFALPEAGAGVTLGVAWSRARPGERAALTVRRVRAQQLGRLVAR